MFKFARPWSDIDALGKLKVSKSSYIYVIVVPVLSRIFENVKSPLDLTIAGESFPLDITFPFTWYTFYFGALCIAVGSAIYTLWCPPMIKLYPNYGAFLAAGKDDSFIRKSAQFLDEHTASTLVDSLDSIKPIALESRSYPVGTGAEQLLLETTTMKDNPSYAINRRDVFNEVFSRINHVRTIARWLASLFYYVGILAFVSIVFWNAWLVIQSLL